jgi:phenylacetate-CoA ligase
MEMESWGFPPRYDPDYRPDASSRYWFPARETMPAADRDRAILQRLQEVCRYAYANSSFYRRKWDDAGFHPDHLRSLEDFEDKVPVITKRDLRESQARAPSFGDYLCVPESEIFHIHGTSGTTGRPTAFAINRRDWNAIANAHARVMWGMGIRPERHRCSSPAILSLYLGSWGALAGAERLGARSFPIRRRSAGHDAARGELAERRQADLCSTGPRRTRCTWPTLRSKEGLRPREFGLKRLFFSGEPGASIPSVCDKLVEAYDAKVFDCGSMAEMTPWMSAAGTEESSPGMLLWQDIVYSEVCDPKTFRRVPYGQRGTPVYTHLERTSQPMIRLVSGDLTVWENGPDAMRAYLSAPASGYLRAHRRHVHDPRARTSIRARSIRC